MEERTIRATTYPDTQHGGCNFCNRHITDYGEATHRVMELSGDGLLARICPRCAKDVLPALRQFAARDPNAHRLRSR